MKKPLVLTAFILFLGSRSAEARTCAAWLDDPGRDDPYGLLAERDDCDPICLASLHVLCINDDSSIYDPDRYPPFDDNQRTNAEECIMITDFIEEHCTVTQPAAPSKLIKKRKPSPTNNIKRNMGI